MPTAAGFNLTPVKSTALHRPDAIDLRRQGAVGDRRFLFVRDDGTRLSGISKSTLMPIHAAWDRDDESLTLTFEDGSRITGNATPGGEPVTVALYDRQVTARPVDGTLTEAVRDLVDGTLTLVRVEEPEYAGGRHRVSIVSRASVADLGERMGEPSLDPRRFRMLIELEGCEPYEEDSWQGRRVGVGGAIVRIGSHMPRCVMTTLDPDTGEQNAPVLDTLARYRKVDDGLLLGVGGDVECPGVIRVNDPIELLD
jgi:hypothetical protein